jgi:hypothetical protein
VWGPSTLSCSPPRPAAAQRSQAQRPGKRDLLTQVAPGRTNPPRNKSRMTLPETPGRVSRPAKHRTSGQVREAGKVMSADQDLAHGAEPVHDHPVATLVMRARNGDELAWGALVERYAPLIWSLCRRYRLDGAAAGDAG